MRLLRTLTSILAAAVCASTSVCAESVRPRTAKADTPATELADPKADDVARGWFGKPPGKAKGYACFERIYDAAHLAKHPLQKVGSMLLLVRGEMIAEDPVANYSVALRVTYKNATARFFSSGYCGHPAAGAAGLHCGIDCDGGSLDVALASDTRSTLVSLERIAVWPEYAAADDEHRGHLDSGADDKSFRLQRVALSHCVPQLGNDDEIAEFGRSK